MSWTARRIVVATAAIGACALAAGLTLATASRSATRRATSSPSCALANPQPAQPLQLNTVPVTVGQIDYVKSVAMEKEVFVCQPRAIKDVETFIDLIEVRKGATMQPFTKSIQQTACLTTYPAGAEACSSQPLPLGPPVTNALEGCVPLPPAAQPAAPVQMNSVVVHGQLVKTVKVEKQVWGCKDNTLIADAYTFTEITEFAPKRFFATSKLFEGIVCFKSVTAAKVLFCRQEKIGPLS